MTQDQPQTPEPNQPQPPESPTDEEKLTDATLTEVTLTDATLADAILGDVPPEEHQLQSTDSPLAESVASIEVSATEEPPIAPPGEPSVPSASPVPDTVAEKTPAASASQPSSSSKVGALIRLVGQLWGVVLPMLIIVGRWAWQVTLVTLKWIREAWKVLLPKIRTLLPEAWRKLPDWVLTTVAVLLLVFVLWLTAQLFSGSKPATAIDRTPPSLTAPESPTEPVSDPEQIANLQTQVAEITDQYAEGLIQAVQANFQADLLTVQLGNSWFNLDTASQTQLANELLKRSHKLKFQSLELTNTEGELLARSPVVGSKMVVYKKDEG